MTTVFLDRDGVLNRKAPEGRYTTDPADVVLLPGAGRAVARLTAAGWLPVVVSNQRGIAKGLYSEAELAAVNDRLRALLAVDEARIDLWLHCPHEIGTCSCRKPLTGMLERARHLDPRIDFHDCYLIGDSASDIEAGRSIGARTIWIRSDAQPGDAGDDHREAYSLSDAVDLLLAPLTLARSFS